MNNYPKFLSHLPSTVGRHEPKNLAQLPGNVNVYVIGEKLLRRHCGSHLTVHLTVPYMWPCRDCVMLPIYM